MSVLHLHLVLNHVPVVGLALVALMLAIALWRNNTEIARLGLVFVIGLAVVAGVVFLTGEPAEEAVENVAGVAERAIHAHEEAAEVGLIATSLAGILSLVGLAVFRGRSLPRWATGAALVIVLVASGVMGWAANLGGQIRHTELGTSIGSGSGSDPDDR